MVKFVGKLLEKGIRKFSEKMGGFAFTKSAHFGCAKTYVGNHFACSVHGSSSGSQF